jgi:hypothetical protein
MLPLLAESTPLPAALASWLEVFFYLLGGIAAVVGLLVGVKSLREKPAEVPQPLTVKEQKRFATWEELQAVRAEVLAIGGRFDEAVERMRDDGAGRVALLEQHLNELKSEIKEDNNTLHARVTELLAAFAEFRGEARAKLSPSK